MTHLPLSVGRLRNGGLLAALILCLGLPAVAEQVVEKHDDGGPKLRYRTDAKGRKDGPYEELFPGGKPKVKGTYAAGEKHGKWTTRTEDGKVHELASYKKGVLDGPYALNYPSGKARLKGKYRRGSLAGPLTVLNEKGKTQRVITYPRPRGEVEQVWAKLYVKEPSAPKFSTDPKLDPPYRAGTMSPESLAEALKMVQLYRYLSGVPWQDMRVDPALCDRAQHGAVLLAKLGQLTHTPTQPEDMDAAFFKAAYAGCNQSNLHQGQGTLVEGVHGFMDDSDESNIKMIGHRQWVLSPGLQKVGFGAAGGFVAMHVLDGSRPGTIPRGFAAFPGEGYYPRDLVKPHHAWSVHLDRNKVKLAGADSVQVHVARLDDLYDESDEISATVVNVAEGAGSSVAIIFTVELKSVDAGKYWVSVRGITDAGGKSAPLNYIVDLIDLPAPPDAAERGRAQPSHRLRRSDSTGRKTMRSPGFADALLASSAPPQPLAQQEPILP